MLSFPLWPIALAWSVVALLTALQQLALGHFGSAGPGALPSTYVLVVLWAVATPFVLQSAARWPIGKDRPWAAIARHLLVAAAFVVATNVLIRLPRLWSDPASLVSSTARGLAMYGLYAMLAYGAIVAIGHAMRARSAELRTEPGSDDGDHAAALEPPPCLVVRESDVRRIIPVETIAWVEADDNYVRIHGGGETVRARIRLAEVERNLPADGFLRVHRSAIVALHEVRAVVPRIHGDWTVELRCGREFPVARSRRKALESALASLAVS
jgi:hypothetical protein